MTQAVVWAGELGEAGVRRATLLGEGGVVCSMSGDSRRPPSSAAPTLPPRAGEEGGWFLYEADDSVERVGLLGVLCAELGLLELHAGLGVLCGRDRVESPWVTGFEVLERLAWRRERVRDAVLAHGGGVVEVKTRGKACDPDAEQAALRGDGAEALTVFVLRLGERVEAFVCRR